MTPSDEASLFAAILKDPDSDDLRERFAKAIEHREPERARFIRLQLDATMRLRRNDETWWEPAADADKLIKSSDHYQSWAGPIVKLMPQSAFWYFRGFVEKVKLDAADFLARGEELFASAPIRRLSLRANGAIVERLFESPLLANVVSLSLQSQRIGDRGVKAIAASPYLGKLALLDLSGNEITRDGLASLMQSSKLPSLRHVDVSSNPVYEEIGPEYSDDQGVVVWYNEEFPIEQQLGRRRWLHTVRELGRNWLLEDPY